MKNIMPTKDLLALTTSEMNALSKSDLQRAARQLADVANKRYTRMSQSKEGTSHANIALESSGGKFGSLKGMTVNQLRHEFSRAQKYLNMETSTIKGAREVRRRTAQRIGGQAKNWTEDDWKKYWNAYNAIKNSEGGNYAQYLLGSDQLQEMLRDEFVKDDFDTQNLIDNIDDVVNDFQQRKQEEWRAIDDEFFDLFGI